MGCNLVTVLSRLHLRTNLELIAQIINGKNHEILLLVNVDLIEHIEQLIEHSISCHDEIRNAVEFITHYCYQVVFNPPRILSELKLQNNYHIQIHVYTIKSVFRVLHHVFFVRFHKLLCILH